MDKYLEVWTEDCELYAEILISNITLLQGEISKDSEQKINSVIQAANALISQKIAILISDEHNYNLAQLKEIQKEKIINRMMEEINHESNN